MAARLAIAAVCIYQALLAALVFIRPELDPSRQPISEYAIGRLGWIMVLAFLISALSYASLFVAIKSQIRGLAGQNWTRDTPDLRDWAHLAWACSSQTR